MLLAFFKLCPSIEEASESGDKSVEVPMPNLLDCDLLSRAVDERDCYSDEDPKWNEKMVEEFCEGETKLSLTSNEFWRYLRKKLDETNMRLITTSIRHKEIFRGPLHRWLVISWD